MTKNWKTLGIAFLGFLFGLTMVSCEKEEPTVAKIKVVDIDGNPVNNAKVYLHGTSTTTPPRANIIHDTTYTDLDGYATFDFSDHFNLGQAGVFVLDIKVERLPETGTGIIKINQEEMNEERIIIE